MKKYLQPMKIVTHDDRFHYDEILGIAVLRIIYKDEIREIIRTRDPELINKGDIVIDVGGVFDPLTNRFDHHQNTFKETFSEKHNVKLSSSGLIYKYLGEKLFKVYNFYKSNEIYENIRVKIYEEFFQYADAIDNGHNIFGDIIPRTLCSFVNLYNISRSSAGDRYNELQYEQFLKVLDLVQKDLENYMKIVFFDYVIPYQEVFKDLKDFEGEVYFSRQNVSIHLIYDIDKALNKNIKFVIYKDKDAYRILTLPVSKYSFTPRLKLLEKYCGLRDEELSRASGIPGCIFVHANGFMGKHMNYKGALDMCYLSLKGNKNDNL